MKKHLIPALLALLSVVLWQGCVSSPRTSTAALDALVEELAAAPAWSDLKAETLESEGDKLVAVAQKTAALSIKDLRYVEFTYLARFEDARMKRVMVNSDDGTGTQQPFARISVPRDKRADYRRAWSKLHVIHRVYFDVPGEYPWPVDVNPAEVPRTENEWKKALYPLKFVDGRLRIVKTLQNESLARDPRAEFAYLAYVYGSRKTGEKVRYDYW